MTLAVENLVGFYDLIALEEVLTLLLLYNNPSWRLGLLCRCPLLRCRNSPFREVHYLLGLRERLQGHKGGDLVDALHSSGRIVLDCRN